MTHKEFLVLSTMATASAPLTQRALAAQTGMSVGSVNEAISNLSDLGFIANRSVTDEGLEALEPFRAKRAVLIAAGFGSRMVPVTLNTPKPLVRVGGKRIIGITEKVVPFMGIGYVLVSLIVIFTHIGNIPQTFSSIFSDAFNFKAIFGGLSGSCLVYGIKRGLYSNEAGVGSAPNASASADVTHPVKQGLVQTVSVYIDTMLLCTATALMCLSSGVKYSPEL